MMIHEVTEQTSYHKSHKRIGRGSSSGFGKTAGRGHKGAGSRSGFNGSIRASREGGQMPWFRRFAKRGFSNAQFTKHFAIINLKAIDSRFGDGSEINPNTLVEAGLVRDVNIPVKVLGSGELNKKLSIAAHAFSKSAQEKIADAGGTTIII